MLSLLLPQVHSCAFMPEMIWATATPLCAVQWRLTTVATALVNQSRAATKGFLCATTSEQLLWIFARLRMFSSNVVQVLVNDRKLSSTVGKSSSVSSDNAPCSCMASLA